MAIVVQKEIPENKWITSDNNSVFLFSDDTTRKVIWCDILINGEETARIFPDPTGAICFNAKEYIRCLFDDLDCNLDYSQIQIGVLQSFLFQWLKTYKQVELTFNLNFENGDVEVLIKNIDYILGAEQVLDFHKGDTIRNRDQFLFTPFSCKTDQSYYLNYWPGYPFDIQFSNDIALDSSTIDITNLNFTDPPINIAISKSNRLVLDSGNGLNIEPLLPLEDGFNNLSIGNEKLILNKKQTNCEGLYVKWLNNYGGYNYWFFEFFSEQTRATSLGVLENDFHNLEDTDSPTNNLGKESTNTLAGSYSCVDKEEINYLSGITESLKVMIYTGTKNNLPTGVKWLEVNLSNSRITRKNFKNRVPEGNIQFVLSNTNTLRL